MRIISKHKDYYDGGAMYGIDTKRVYLRELSKLNIDKMKIDLNFFEIIGFCGEIFIVLNASLPTFSCSCDHSKIINDWDRNPKDFILFNDDALNYDFVNKNGYEFHKRYNTSDTDKYVKKKINHKWSFRWRKEKYNDILKNTDKLNELFIKHKTPIFHIGTQNRETILTLNPVLKNYAFYKIYDTTQAFQRLEMFISSVLVSDEQGDVPVGGDVILAKSKGFDKWSFRKEKKA